MEGCSFFPFSLARSCVENCKSGDIDVTKVSGGIVQDWVGMSIGVRYSEIIRWSLFAKDSARSPVRFLAGFD